MLGFLGQPTSGSFGRDKTGRTDNNSLKQTCLFHVYLFSTRNDAKLDGHPMLLVDNWDSIFIPLWVFGDEVEYQDRDSLMVYLQWICSW